MEVERYSDPQSFAREVNLPLIGVAHVSPVPAGAQAATLLAADDPEEMKPVVDLLTQTRKSLTLRSLFMTGFPHDPEFFAAGLALARQWSRQGLKVAVVDLDYHHPTLLRPRPDPNEGFVDALEYGCSFQRVAWELVADTLWLVGPGSHPPEDARFVEHPDWARVMRIFSARADITVYLAPFLDRKGFTGALSKRMDGVLLATSVARSSRTALRDAFLELWGSDAPMIGCLGLTAPFGAVPRGEVELKAEPSTSTPSVSSPSAAPPSVSTPSDRSFPSSDPPSPPRAPAPEGILSAPARAAKREERRRESGEPPQALVARLSEEVRTGQAPRSLRGRSPGVFLAAFVLLILAGVGAFVTFQAMNRGGRAGAPEETLPAGTERVLPADLGTPVPDGLPETVPESPIGGAGEADLPADGSAGVETAPPPAPAALNYRVHVASFRSMSKVRDLVDGIRSHGEDAWYAPATDQPGWYRVYVGHYATHQEAERKAAQLLERGWVERARAYPDLKR